MIICGIKRIFDRHKCLSSFSGGKPLCCGSSLEHFKSSEIHEGVPSAEWCSDALPKMEKLTKELKGVDVIDGVLINVADDRFVIDEKIKEKVHSLKSLIRVFIGCPNVQKQLKEKMRSISDAANRVPVIPFSKASERESMTVNSLTQISSFFNIEAHTRKLIRTKICQQVTQHHIWVGALEEILSGVKSEIDSSVAEKMKPMAEQIIAMCIKYLSDPDSLAGNGETCSWMRLTPSRSGDDGSKYSSNWQEVLDIINDLVGVVGSRKGMFYHMEKLEAMKEGLHQVKDVIIDKGMGYREVKFQESLIAKKLLKTLGHPSRCLFTLVMYYLYGHVRDPEVDMRGGMYSGDGGKSFLVFMGRILTSQDDDAIRAGVKQLNRVLGAYKLIWELAEKKEPLVFEGHLWCLGELEKTISYRGNVFYVHGIS